MAIICTPSALVSAAKCFNCLTTKQLRSVRAYLLSQFVPCVPAGSPPGTPPVVGCNAPAAPANLEVTPGPNNPGSTTIAIDWTQPASNPPVTTNNYAIIWSVPRGPINFAVIPGTQLNYTITGLTPSTDYSIVVKAIHGACASSSSVLHTTTAGSGPPPNGLLNNLAHFYQFQEAASLFMDSGTLNPTPLNYTTAGQDFARVAGHVQAFAASYNGANPGNSLGTIAAAPFDFSGDGTGNLSMSYECWFKWSSVQPNGPPQPVFGIVGAAGANQCYILRHTAANTIQWTVVPFGGGASASVTNAAVADDSWHLFVGGFDFANGRIFMSIDNGAFQTAALATMNSINNTAWTCFNWSAGTNVESVGALSDVGVWKGRVFGASDVANLWNGGAGLPFSQFTT